MTAAPPATSLDMTAAATALDAMVLGERRVVSFRALASALDLSTTAAKTVLRAYVASHASADDLAVVWAVTLDTRQASSSPALPAARAAFALARAPHPGPADCGGDTVLSATVWAVSAAAAAPAGDAVWVAADRAREFDMVRAPPADLNELRDGRFGMYKSETSSWLVGASAEAVRRPATVTAGVCDLGSAPAKKAMSLFDRMKSSGVDHEKERQHVSKSTKSSLLSTFTSRAKAAAAASHAARKKSDSGTVAQVRPNMTLNAATSVQFPSSSRPPSANTNAAGLVTDRSKLPEPVEVVPEASVRKVRRIVEHSDDEDDESESARGGNDVEESESSGLSCDRGEETDEGERQGRGPAAKHNLTDVDILYDADVSKRTAPEADPMNLGDDGDGFDEIIDSTSHCDGEIVRRSPVGAAVRKPSRDAGTDVATRSAKRIRRMVEETMTDEKGYIVTRIVAKYFDVDGNELRRDEPRSQVRSNCVVKDIEDPSKMASALVTSRENVLPRAADATAPTKTSAKHDSLTPGGSRDTAAISAPGGSKKSSKKPKGNIASFFGKK
jgi:hypothetical protein